MGTKIKDGRIKPKKESTFGKVKKPFKGKDKNRKGSKKLTGIKDKPVKHSSRNPLSLYSFYVYMRDIANSLGCDAHHWLPKSKLNQDIFLAFVPYNKHRSIHAEGNCQSPMEWAEEQGIIELVNFSVVEFEIWAIENDLPDEYFVLIEKLKNNPLDYHNIARDFILNNRSL